MAYRRQLLLASASVAAFAAVAGAQTSVVTDASPGLLGQAKIGADSATRLAQTRLPAGTIQSAEIESEHGRLINSFDIRLAGRTGIDEVNVAAMTGVILAVEPESPGAEAAGRKADGLTAKARP
jgi:uncharacterized membrane protein YkoI